MFPWGNLGRFGNTRSVLTIFVALTTVAIIGQTWWAVQQDHALTLASEQAHGLVAVRLLEEHASQQLQGAAQRLDVVAIGVASIIQHAPLNESQIRTIIEDSLKNNRAAGALQYVNLDGQRWASMIDFPAYVFPAEQRAFIPLLLGHPDNKGVVVGHPFGRLIDGELVLPLARNLYDYSGRHVGLISTEVSLAYFNSVYQRVATSNEAVVQLFENSGFVIVRSPFDPSVVNRDISASPILKQLRAGPDEGTFNERAMLEDGRLRLFAYRKVKGFPVSIVFGRDFDSILGNWSVRTRDRISFSGIFIALHLLLTFYLLQHMGKLQMSENRLRESESKFGSLFQFAPIPLALIRLDNDQLIEANDAILTQFGHARADFIGRTALELGLWYRPEDRGPYLDMLNREHAVDRYEARLRHKNGDVLICLLSTRMIDSNGARVAIFSPNDVTRQRQSEHEILLLNAQLEQRIRERTANLEEALTTVKSMQTELVRSEKMAALGTLVAGVAHELNTPIGNSVTVASTLADYAEAMRRELHSAHPRRSVLEKTSDALITGTVILMRNLLRAAALVTSFKQVAVDQSSDQRRHFDLQEVVEEIVMTLEPMFKNKHTLALTLAPGVQMDSYPGALTQVLTNFVSNAINHGLEGRTGGHMCIATRAIGTDQVEVRFSDDGCGISPENLGRVFDPFFTTKLGQGGSGLGMNIVYNLVTSVLGGSISLTSTPGNGTVATVVLPLRAPERALVPA